MGEAGGLGVRDPPEVDEERDPLSHFGLIRVGTNRYIRVKHGSRLQVSYREVACSGLYELDLSTRKPSSR